MRVAAIALTILCFAAASFGQQERAKDASLPAGSGEMLSTGWPRVPMRSSVMSMRTGLNGCSSPKEYLL